MADPLDKADIGGALRRQSRFSRIAASDLPARAAAGIVLMVAALAAAAAGGYWFTAFWLVAALIVHWEWQNLIGGPNQNLRAAFGGGGLVVAAPLASNDAVFWAIVALLAGAIAASLTSGVRPRFRLMPGAGVIYAGAMLASVCLLRASW